MFHNPLDLRIPLELLVFLNKKTDILKPVRDRSLLIFLVQLFKSQQKRASRLIGLTYGGYTDYSAPTIADTKI